MIKSVRTITIAQFVSQALNFIVIFAIAKCLRAGDFTEFMMLKSLGLLSIEYGRFVVEKSLVRGSVIIDWSVGVVSLIILSVFIVLDHALIGLSYLLISIPGLVYVVTRTWLNLNSRYDIVSKLDVVYSGLFSVPALILISISFELVLEYFLIIDILKFIVLFLLSLKYSVWSKIGMLIRGFSLFNIVHYLSNYLRQNILLVVAFLGMPTTYKDTVVLFGSLSDLFRNRILPIVNIYMLPKLQERVSSNYLGVVVLLGLICQILLANIPQNILQVIIDVDKTSWPFYPYVLAYAFSTMVMTLVGVYLRFQADKRTEMYFSIYALVVAAGLFFATDELTLWLISLTVVNILSTIFFLYANKTYVARA